MAVIMIGSTGNGKSALGNFLLDPDEHHLYDNQSFPRAKNNKPCTQESIMVTKTVSSPSLEESKQLTVIDTPGLNESIEKDLEHMKGLLEKLEEVEDINACLIVVKFDGKIDTQYMDTIRYYSQLLPSLFEKNLVIIMTNFEYNKRAEKRRERDGIDVEEIEENAIETIFNICKLPFKPMHFKINSLPDDDEDIKENLELRDAILSLVFSLEATKITKFKMQKPNAIITEHDIEKSKLEGEITAYEQQIAYDNKALGEVVKNIGAMKQEVRDYDAKLRNLRNEKSYYDTSDKVDVDTWKLSWQWKLWNSFTGKTSDSFHIESEYPLRDVSKYGRGITWTRFEEKAHSVSGCFCRSDKGKLSFYASVTYRTYRRDKYAKTIEGINNEITRLEAYLSALNERIVHEEKRNSEYADQLKKHDMVIHERKEKILKLSLVQLSMQEATDKLKSLTIAN